MFNSLFNETAFIEFIRKVVREEVASALNGCNTPQVDSDSNLIKGVRGLAEFLGCGTNKAQNIVNSEILLKKKIQYSIGDGWRFRKDKLADLLEKEPEILKKVRKK